MSSDIFRISQWNLAWDTKQNELGGTVEYEDLYGFLDCGICSSEITVCYLQIMHKTAFIKGHELVQQ